MAIPHDTRRACDTLQELQRQLSSLACEGNLTAGLLQAATDECPEAVLVADDKARIIMVNGPAARLLGISTRELQTLTLWDITHPTYQHDFEVLWREFLRAGRQRGHYGVRHVSGSVVEVTYCAGAKVLANHAVIVLCRLS